MIKNMVTGIIKIDIGQIVEIEEYHSVVEYNMDRVTETDQGIIRPVEVILEEEISEGICDQIRIIEIKIIQGDIEENIETRIIKEVEVGLGIDSIPIILEGMIEVMVGLDQVQELVPIEIELDAINVGNIIILLRTVQLLKQKRSQTKFNKCTIWTKNRLH